MTSSNSTPVSPQEWLARLQPEPTLTIAEMASTDWDVVVVGGGHNGLTTAAYLSLGGQSVLVLERRDRLGGAATLEEMWPGYVVSPCAYLAGLLHPKVIDDLDLKRRGLRIRMGNPTYFCPFEDGTSFTAWADTERTIAGLAKLNPALVDGYRARNDAFDRARQLLRPEASDADLWLAPPPTAEQVRERLNHDPELIGLVFEDSQVENLRRYFDDERMITAFAGQGIIGTNASPFDPGTASIDFHHSSGHQEGLAGEWGFVLGGIGAVSATLAEAATDAGATIAVGLPVAAIHPGVGVELESGDLIRTRTIVSNADPARTASLLCDADSKASSSAGGDGDYGLDELESFRSRVDRVPITGATTKVTYALRALPDFGEAHAHLAQVEVLRSAEALHQSYLAAKAGTITDELWGELYFQTPYDPSIAPPGKEVLSAFCQYVPYTWADGGSWDDHRDEVGDAVTRSIERFAPGFASLIEHLHVDGPPDIEERVGLTGGHIFQGEILPDHMWADRLPAFTGIEGLYLCGAGTYPGGSVIGINGYLAATQILRNVEAPR